MISRVDAVKEQLFNPRLFCQLPEEDAGPIQSCFMAVGERGRGEILSPAAQEGSGLPRTSGAGEGPRRTARGRV